MNKAGLILTLAGGGFFVPGTVVPGRREISLHEPSEPVRVKGTFKEFRAGFSG